MSSPIRDSNRFSQHLVDILGPYLPNADSDSGDPAAGGDDAADPAGDADQTDRGQGDASKLKVGEDAEQAGAESSETPIVSTETPVVEWGSPTVPISPPKPAIDGNHRNSKSPRDGNSANSGNRNSGGNAANESLNDVPSRLSSINRLSTFSNDDQNLNQPTRRRSSRIVRNLDATDDESENDNRDTDNNDNRSPVAVSLRNSLVQSDYERSESEPATWSNIKSFEDGIGVGRSAVEDGPNERSEIYQHEQHQYCQDNQDHPIHSISNSGDAERRISNVILGRETSDEENRVEDRLGEEGGGDGGNSSGARNSGFVACDSHGNLVSDDEEEGKENDSENHSDESRHDPENPSNEANNRHDNSVSESDIEKPAALASVLPDEVVRSASQRVSTVDDIASPLLITEQRGSTIDGFSTGPRAERDAEPSILGDVFYYEPQNMNDNKIIM
jgi:hypothetical protein